jgi:hypothetical protein
MKFEENIYSFKPIFFHFLDGYINKNIESNIFELQTFIDNNHDTLFLDYSTSNNILILFNIIDIDDLFNKIYEHMLYVIIQTTHNKHATSLVFFMKNEKFYILSFNSGLGINNHNKYNNKFLPYCGIEINNKDDFRNLYNVILELNGAYNFFFQSELHIRLF